jgi:large subunit ribosomal protein L25
MEEIILKAEARQDTGRGKVHGLRAKGLIPAVVYSGGKDALSIQMGHKEFLGLVHHYRIEGVVINLNIQDDPKHKNRPCLIKEIQYDPVHGDIIHVDFNQISLTKAIKVNVPVVAQGEPAGVKLEGGSLEHILWEVEVECLPTAIPKEFTVDVSQLKIGDSIHVRDLSIPAGVKVINEPDAIVLSVAAPMKEEVVAPVEGEVSQEPEVIKEKKEVPAEGEEAAPAKEGSAKEAKEKK